MQADISKESLVRFDGFEMALKSGELRRAGRLVKLQPQPFKVLALLVAHAGQIITREEIQQQIWEGDTFVDFEHGLNFCIKQIRAALGDSAQSPRYIETLPRRGYRFIAEIEMINGNGAATLPDTQENVDRSNGRAKKGALVYTTGLQEPVADSKREPWPKAAFIIVGLFAVAAAILFWWLRDPGPPAQPSGKAMLAVLPFENLGATADEDYFSDGLTEEMIARLGQLEPARLGVIARTSAMTYKGSNKDIRSIGRELGVDYVLEGSVRREADRVRITAQLIKVSDQTHLWAESYDRTTAGALTIQSEVASRIASSLAIELLPALADRPAAAVATNPEAHDAYLKGRYLWNKGATAEIKKSIEYFEQAIEKDPRYALAYAGLADAYRLAGMYNTLRPREALPKSGEAAARALELDETLAEAHAALGSFRFWFEWNWEEAEREFRRAIELNPSYGHAHHDYAWYLVVMGRMGEGIAEMRRAQELDPLSPLANADVGWVYLRARRYDEAIEQMKRTLELEPDSHSAQSCLEQAYIYTGRYGEALEAARASMKRAGASVEEIKATEHADAKEAIRNVQRWRLKRRLEAAPTHNLSAYGFATLYASMGEKDQAFAWLEKAFEERDLMLVSIKADPVYDSLRDDARFDRLLKRMGFPDSR